MTTRVEEYNEEFYDDWFENLSLTEKINIYEEYEEQDDEVDEEENYWEEEDE